MRKRLNNFPAGYVGKFYENLANNIDHDFVGSDFYERIANDTEIPSADVQKYILATSDFAKGIQTDINHYVTKDRINNASFRQKLDPISNIIRSIITSNSNNSNKNIIRRQNPLELDFKDISTFDVENPIGGSLFKELDVGKKDIASELIKKAPRPPGVDIAIRRIDKLKDRSEPKDDMKSFATTISTTTTTTFIFTKTTIRNSNPTSICTATIRKISRTILTTYSTT